MILDVLVSYTRDDAFVAIDKPQNLKFFPYGAVYIRVLLVLALLRLDRFRVGRAHDRTYHRSNLSPEVMTTVTRERKVGLIHCRQVHLAGNDNRVEAHGGGGVSRVTVVDIHEKGSSKMKAQL